MAAKQGSRSGDYDVAATAEARLRESPRFAEGRVSCHFEQGTLTLRGCVPSYSLKHAAESLVGRIDGVVTVDNRLEVMPFPSSYKAGDDAGPLPPEVGRGAD